MFRVDTKNRFSCLANDAAHKSKDGTFLGKPSPHPTRAQLTRHTLLAATAELPSQHNEKLA
ncbi:Uncharacterised protein [Vibrio cholerae]|nr:Uncharacterised protein [Vibrio cholerae]